MTDTGIQVRPAKLHDFFRLRAMRSDASSPERESGSLGQRVIDSWPRVLFSRRERRSYVAFSGNVALGLLELTTDPANHRWVISRIATNWRAFGRAEHSRELIWQELALQAIRSAGASRAKRVHATFPESSAVIPSLVAIGFNEYAQDTVLLAPSLPKREPAEIARRQESSDLWAVHQLYHSVTPRPVQYAEALTSNYWSKAMPGEPAPRSYVVEDGLEIVAHCRVVPLAGGLALYPMVQPGRLELLQPLIHDVLADLNPPSSTRIRSVVPDYLQEYVSRLEDLGFVPEGRQTRLVKYTVVARRMQFRGVDELSRDVKERVVAGTPLSYVSPGSDQQPGGRFNGSGESSKERNGYC